MTASRPAFHLTAESGWVNDPLGLSFHDGTYHLFFQYVPGQVVWGPHCHWGHATSPDLLRWTLHPPALEPGDGDDGCWSGCLVTAPGAEAVLLYTSVALPNPALGRVRVARPVDRTWQRWIKGEVVAEIPAGLPATSFRDPVVLRDGERWLMIVGAGLADGTATALTYASPDLHRWTYAGPLAERHTGVTEPVWTGSLWECPQLVRLDGGDVLVVSVYDADVLEHVAAAVGGYRDGRFEPRRWTRLSYGPSFYAASAFRDEAGRPGLIGWLRGITDPAGHWAGALSVPMLLGVGPDDRLRLEPHPAVAAARGAALGGRPAGLEWPPGAAVDVEWTPPAAGTAALDLLGADGVLGRVAVGAGTVTLTVSDGPAPVEAPWAGGSLRLLLDGPVLEVFPGDSVLAVPVRPVHRGVQPSDGEPVALRGWALGSG